MSKKRLEELTIKDSFMFFALMKDMDICRELLELILEIEISEVHVEQEKTLMNDPRFHGVRLDMSAVEKWTNRKFNVEMQTRKEGNLGKRARYYHSQMDMDMLKTAEEYAVLPDSYVIFLCDFDPFDEGAYVYRFENYCFEKNLRLKDGLYTVFLNSRGKDKENISQNLCAFLDYMANPEVSNNDDLFVKRVDQKIKTIKSDIEWGNRYMVLEMMLKEERKEGREEGREETLREMIIKMYDYGMPVDEISRMCNTPIDEIKNMINK